MSELSNRPNHDLESQNQNAKAEHTIYRNMRHGQHERPVEETGLDGGDPNLAGGIENAEAIEDIVGDGIVEARHAGSNIDEGTARTIARALANALNASAAHLDSFASTGVGDRRFLEQEYFELYGDDTTPEVIRSWIDWLASFLFWRDFPDHPAPLQMPSSAAELPGMLVPGTVIIDDQRIQLNWPASITTQLQALSSERLTPLLVAHGEAFRAYLTLPDINATDDTLLDNFQEHFEGVYDDIDDIMDNLSELRDWEAQLEAWALDRGLSGMVSIDREEVAAVTRTMWDIVEIGGRCYVFHI